MTALQLATWLLALPSVLDGNGHPIFRPRAAAMTIATVAIETDSPTLFAAHLDVIAAHESAYRVNAVGDSGRSCGAYQTPCARTPSDALGQTRLAVAILKQAMVACAEHPLFSYASGRCMRTAVAMRYEADLQNELSALMRIATM